MALAKPYSVDYLALSRFLNSEAGEAFLVQQSQAYRPLAIAATLAASTGRCRWPCSCRSWRPEQCRSVLSWWIFLPACLQAAAMPMGIPSFFHCICEQTPETLCPGADV